MRYILTTVLILLVILLRNISSSATIFSDNFDSQNDNCRTGGDIPSGWSAWYENDIGVTKDSVYHYAGEISFPGKGGIGKSLKIWRHSNWPIMNNYSGGIGYEFPPSHTYSNIFFRYYIKLPVDLTLTTDDYLKSWRFNTSGGSGEIYLDFRVGNDGEDMKTLGTWGIYDGGAGWTTVLDNAGLREIWDGNWHCVEFQLGISNRTLRLWVDGVEKYSNTSFDWAASGQFEFIQHVAIGNVADGSSWQNSWQAIEFDDFVIADSYVGPGDDEDDNNNEENEEEGKENKSGGGSGGGRSCFISVSSM